MSGALRVNADFAIIIVKPAVVVTDLFPRWNDAVVVLMEFDVRPSSAARWPSQKLLNTILVIIVLLNVIFQSID